MKITRSADCGNSPKNQLLETMAIALAACDWAEIAKVATADISWDRVGGTAIQSFDRLRATLEENEPCTEISIEHVLSHGRAGAVNGIVRSEATQKSFCHIFEFGNAKGASIKSVKTYEI